MIKSASDKHAISWLKRNVNDTVESTLSPKEKSDIIYSILVGVPAPMIILEEKELSYDVVNGKELFASIMQFIHGRIVIESNPLFDAETGDKYVNKTYFDFTDEEKEVFLDITIFVHKLRGLNDNQRKAIEYTYSSMNVSSSIAGELAVSSTSEIDSTLEKILAHKFFESVNISSPSIDLVTQFLMITEEGTTTELRVKDIIAFKENIDKEPNISNELDYLAKAYTEKSTYLKKTHLPMVFVCAKVALKDKVKPEKFKGIMDKFFEDMSDEYKKACDSSSSRSKANTRLKVLMQYYKDNK